MFFAKNGYSVKQFGKIADSVSIAIKSYSKEEEHFFFVAGLHKPHLVFASPEKYWKLYKDMEKRSLESTAKRNGKYI